MKFAGIVLFISLAVVFTTVSSYTTYPDIDVKCEVPSDCHHAYTCYNNECVHACQLRNSNVLGNKCGENAACMTRESHSAICGCQPFHIGNPDVGCVKVSKAEYFADLAKRNQH